MHHLDSRAVWISDDTCFLPLRNVLGIDLWHDKRDIFVHSKMAGVVDDERARIYGKLRKFSRHATACAEKGYIYGVFFKHAFGKLLHAVAFALKFHFTARTFGTCKRQNA